eukprot:418420_1
MGSKSSTCTIYVPVFIECEGNCDTKRQYRIVASYATTYTMRNLLTETINIYVSGNKIKIKQIKKESFTKQSYSHDDTRRWTSLLDIPITWYNKNDIKTSGLHLVIEKQGNVKLISNEPHSSELLPQQTRYPYSILHSGKQKQNHHISICSNLKSLKATLCCNQHELLDRTHSIALLNDFLHLLTQHDNDADFECIVNWLGQCNIEKCKVFRRNYRNRSARKEMLTEQTNRIADKIHCYYYHSFDIGSRFNISEQDEINKGQDDLKDFTETKLTKKKFFVMNKILSKKKNMVKQFDRLKQKYVLLSPKYFHTVDKRYGCGYSFNYEGKNQNGMKVSPRLSSLKDELITNNIHNISITQYMNEYEKAIIHFKSCYKKKKYTDMSMAQILSLMFYCNFTQLQLIFSRTYRENIEEHSSFYHWGKNLNVAVNSFGDNVAFGGIEELYHVIGEILVFPMFHNAIHIYGPLSTTSTFAVAMNFTGSNNGMIVQFCDSKWRLSKYFSVSWLSDFANESEYLFVQNQYPLQINNIYIMSKGCEYGCILKALTLFTGSFYTHRNVGIDVMETVEDYNLLSDLIIHTLSKYSAQYEPKNYFDEYAQKMFDVFRENKRIIRISHLVFLRLIEWNKVTIQMLEQVFPKLQRIKIDKRAGNQIKEGKQMKSLLDKLLKILKNSEKIEVVSMDLDICIEDISARNELNQMEKVYDAKFKSSGFCMTLLKADQSKYDHVFFTTRSSFFDFRDVGNTKHTSHIANEEKSTEVSVNETSNTDTNSIEFNKILTSSKYSDIELDLVTYKSMESSDITSYKIDCTISVSRIIVPKFDSFKG